MVRNLLGDCAKYSTGLDYVIVCVASTCMYMHTTSSTTSSSVSTVDEYICVLTSDLILD